MTAVLRPALSRVWSPDADGGMQLELWAHVEGRDQTVLTVLADPQDESLWVGVQLGETRLQLPLVVPNVPARCCPKPTTSAPTPPTSAAKARAS